MNENISILGAGLAGLVAAYAFPKAIIIDGKARGSGRHTALLRFRSDAVSNLTGIPFKRVTVRKAIFFNGKLYNECNIQMANMYSRRVGVGVRSRSIWSLSPQERFIPPEDFQERMENEHDGNGRIRWDTPLVRCGKGGNTPVISTIPLPAMLKACEIHTDEDFGTSSTAVYVSRFRIPDCDVYQTIYFPEYDAYRASITGDILTIESKIPQDLIDKDPCVMSIASESVRDILYAFGLFHICDNTIGEYAIDGSIIRNGKIIDLPEDKRKAILYELTREYNVFSVGRFATWRNILMDDVVKDLGVVRSLINSSEYGRSLSINRSK